MEKRRLGKTGLEISPIVFGGNVFGWTADEKTSFDLLDAFFDAGFNTIDTADVYSAWGPGHLGGESETIIGNWFQKNKVARDKVVIVTKVGSEMGPGKKGLKERYILQAVEDSLRRLKTDYIDLYLSHWPDQETPYEETLGTYAKLKQQGKIRAAGCSNLDAAQLQASFDATRSAGTERYDAIQPEYNLYDRGGFEGPLAELCVKEDIGVITYFSLAAGFLTGKYRSKEDAKGKARGGKAEGYLNDKGFKILDALDTVAAETGSTPAAVALAWLINKKGVTAPIASATSREQLQSLVKAADLRLSSEAMSLLDEAGA